MKTLSNVYTFLSFNQLVQFFFYFLRGRDKKMDRRSMVQGYRIAAHGTGAAAQEKRPTDLTGIIFYFLIAKYSLQLYF